jgi:hypothetical protein
MKKVLGQILLAVMVMVFCSGCLGRMVGEGAEKTLGPKGAYWQEKSLAYSKKDKVLASYTNFVLGKVRNDFGRNVPRDFFTLFPDEFEKALDKAKLPNVENGKTLVVNVTVIHYETADETDNVLGPLEQVVARVQLVDKGTNKVLAYGNVVGRTGKSVGLGVEWKARGLAKGIVKWISDYYPRKHKDKDDEEE